MTAASKKPIAYRWINLRTDTIHELDGRVSYCGGVSINDEGWVEDKRSARPCDTDLGYLPADGAGEPTCKGCKSVKRARLRKANEETS